MTGGPDLRPLEATLAGLGLPGRTARVVTHDGRRGWWFRWDERELRVSAKVLERCPPDDAQALLVNAVFERRRLSGLKRRALVSGLLLVVAVVATGRWVAPPWSALPAALLGALWAAWVMVERSRARLMADDATVDALGGAEGAERLVRALNKMDIEELHLGGYHGSARPDIHKRAERLVTRHQLCSALGGDDPADAAGS